MTVGKAEHDSKKATDTHKSTLGATVVKAIKDSPDYTVPPCSFPPLIACLINDYSGRKRPLHSTSHP